MSLTRSLWEKTPLNYSNHISEILGCSAYLKLECLQPSHSFKYRGLSLAIQRTVKHYDKSVQIIIASGGNAGLAAATVSKILGVRCFVFVPQGVSSRTKEFLERQNAEVIIEGKSYGEALQAARRMVKRKRTAVMVSAYDDPVLWEGHSSMISEIKEQLGRKPDAVFCSVGGGGLLGGIIVGCKREGWDDVPIVTLETRGSDCFYHTMQLNRNNCEASRTLPEDIEVFSDENHDVELAYINRFSSRASESLGANSPAGGVVRMALEREGRVTCISVPDEISMEAAVKFADNQMLLVELASSTALTPAYQPKIFMEAMKSRPAEGADQSLSRNKCIVFIVCGGFKISLETLAEFRELYQADLKKGPEWEVLCDGEVLRLEKPKT